MAATRTDVETLGDLGDRTVVSSVVVSHIQLWEANRLLLHEEETFDGSHTWLLELGDGMLWLTRAGEDWWETVLLPVAGFGTCASASTSVNTSGRELEGVLSRSTTAAILLTQHDGQARIDGHDITGGSDRAITRPPRAEDVPVGQVELQPPRSVPHVRGGWSPATTEIHGLHVKIPGGVARRFHARKLTSAALSRRTGDWYVSAVTPDNVAGIGLWVLGRVQVL